MWLYYNLFQPVMRLTEKTSIREEGQTSGVKRRFDQARTPFDRLCATTAVSRERQEQLKALRDKTNPRRLRQEIYDLLGYVSSLPGAVPGVTEEVRLTLMTDSGVDENAYGSQRNTQALNNPERSGQAR